MDIDATFLDPVAVQLIDNVFPTDIVYVEHTDETAAYDPLTGIVPITEVQHPIKAGVLSRGRVEEGGVGEVYELRLWIHHGATGYTGLPKISDSVIYDGTTWKVTNVDPTYSSVGLIASKLICRSD